MQAMISPVFAWLSFETPFMLGGLIIMTGLLRLTLDKR
jgi:hypothetical protein